MLNEILKGIKPLNEEVKELARERLDSLAKPLKSLGKLEDIAIQIAGITGKVTNNIDKKCVIIMSSDNGVVEENIASAPQYVTLAQTKNFVKRKTGVCAIAKANNTEIIPVDIGINSDEKIKGVIDKKIRKGTNNIYKEDAMTREEAKRSIEIGIEITKMAIDKGYNLIGTGEMGIGNTTTSSAMLSVLLNIDSDIVVGKGGGISDFSFEKKKEVVSYAIKSKKIDRNDPIDILKSLGGFDIGGMVGIFLGCAFYRVPVVIDGFISAVSALLAYRLNPLVKDYLIPSHNSMEYGYMLAMKEIGIKPLFDLDMRLGEGSGCPIAFSIIESALSINENMATFEESKIDDSYIDEIREEKHYII